MWCMLFCCTLYQGTHNQNQNSTGQIKLLGKAFGDTNYTISFRFLKKDTLDQVDLINIDHSH